MAPTKSRRTFFFQTASRPAKKFPLSSSVLNCRCRFCGYNLSYPRENIGCDARCPQCAQTIRLPGELSPVATIQSGRHHDLMGLAFEIGGFVCMFLFFPWGIIVGAALVYVGWRKSTAHKCSNCAAPVRPKAEKCPRCQSRFTTDM